MAKFIFQAGVFFKRPLYPANISTVVTVYDAETGSIAPIWNDRAGADPRANPGAIWQEGQIKFYANPGRYNIVASNGSDSKTWNDVLIIDPDAGGGGGVPAGGTTGQILAKASNTDYDTEWVAAGGGALGGRVESGTSYTLQASDRNQYIETTGAMVITIPTEAVVDLGPRFTVAGFHHHATPLTFSISGVTLRFPADLSNSIPQYAGWQLVKSATAADTWNLKAYTELA